MQQEKSFLSVNAVDSIDKLYVEVSLIIEQKTSLFNILRFGIHNSFLLLF